MAGRWQRGGSSGIWCTRAGELLEVIYEHYEEALCALPLEDMPVLAPRLLDVGVCIGFTNPVTNIIANTLFFISDESVEPVPVPDPEEVQDAEWVTLDVVHQRWQDGVFATPWNARFDQLWETLGQRVAEMHVTADGV